MIRKRLIVFSMFLLLVWLTGTFILHNTLDGYLHLFLLLSVNAALLCFFIDQKQQTPETTPKTDGTPSQSTAGCMEEDLPQPLSHA